MNHYKDKFVDAIEINFMGYPWIVVIIKGITGTRLISSDEFNLLPLQKQKEIIGQLPPFRPFFPFAPHLTFDDIMAKAPKIFKLLFDTPQIPKGSKIDEDGNLVSL